MAYNLRTFDLPYGFEHSSFYAGAKAAWADHYGIVLNTDARRWENWVVRLSFKRLGSPLKGNGFYVNIPHPSMDVILTAGHNLVEAPRVYCKDITIVYADGRNIPVSADMIRVCPQYLERPSSLNQIYDYGVILLPRDTARKRVFGFGFGFNLMLGIAPPADERDAVDPLQGRSVFVSGYRPSDDPQATYQTLDKNGKECWQQKNPPRQTDGKCIRCDEDQLLYEADTEAGISGGPVWLGFRGVETVVAIHNYGEETKGRGNRGCRLNLNIWTNIFQWLALGWREVYLAYRGSPDYSMHLHIDPPEQDGPGFARVRVGKPGPVETWFDVLPVSALPNSKYADACYGFVHKLRVDKRSSQIASSPGNRWLLWDAQAGEVSLSRYFDGRCEVKLLHILADPGKPFSIQVRLDVEKWNQIRLGMSYLGSLDLKRLDKNPRLFEDTTEVCFEKISGTARLFELKN